jgi:hypothetical protein
MNRLAGFARREIDLLGLTDDKLGFEFQLEIDSMSLEKIDPRHRITLNINRCGAVTHLDAMSRS